MTQQKTDTGDHLDAVFQIVIDEARTNTTFASRLRAALDGDPAPPIAPKPTPQSSGKSTGKPKSRVTATPDIHAVNVLREHGEQMLRGRLSNLRAKKDLTQVAKRSGLRLTGTAAKKSATRDDLIDGIVTAAVQYDSQRQAVEG